MYRSHEENESKPSEKELQQALHSSFGQFSVCYIVLDALDEYTELYSSQKISSLLKLVLSLNNNIKVLATSRVLEGMEGLFKELGASSEEIVADEKDMATYVEKRIATIGFSFEVPEDFMQEIVKQVVKSAKGRYVSIVCMAYSTHPDHWQAGS
jgi:hypothetical protein